MRTIIECLKSQIESKKTEIQLGEATAEKRWNEYYNLPKETSEDDRYTFFKCCCILDREVQKAEDTLRDLRQSLFYLRRASGEKETVDFDGFKPEIDIQK